MLLRTIGELLPAAMGIALSPFPVIAIVLLLGATHGRVKGAAFTLGWMVALAALMAVIVTFTNGTDKADGTSSTLVSALRVAVGALMIGLAIKKWKTRPRPGDDVELPGWITALDTATPQKSLVLGLGLGGANPKNIALGMSAAASITDLTTGNDNATVATIVFVILASSTVIGALAFHVVGGERSTAPLESVKQFMLANNVVIVMMVLLILGVKILGDGLGGLS